MAWFAVGTRPIWGHASSWQGAAPPPAGAATVGHSPAWQRAMIAPSLLGFLQLFWEPIWSWPHPKASQAKILACKSTETPSQTPALEEGEIRRRVVVRERAETTPGGAVRIWRSPKAKE